MWFCRSGACFRARSAGAWPGTGCISRRGVRLDYQAGTGETASEYDLFFRFVSA